MDAVALTNVWENTVGWLVRVPERIKDAGKF